MAPPPSPSDWDSLKQQLFQFLAIIAVAALVASSGITAIEWYKHQSLPFCHPSSDSTGSCRPCPQHGECHGGNLECSPGFERHRNSCKRDEKIDKSAQAIAEFFEHYVCGMYAESLCKGAGIVWPTMNDLFQHMNQAGIGIKLELDVDKLTVAQEKGMHAIRKSLIIKEGLNGLLEFQCPQELVENYKPLLCRIRGWIYINYFSLLVFIPLVLFMAKLVLRFYHQRKISSRAEQLYLQVCEALEEKATTKKAEGETWVVASRLRDHLLKPSERRDSLLWEHVEQMVKEDSRIDQYPKIVKGEPKVIWEWQVEGALRSISLKKNLGWRNPISTGEQDLPSTSEAGF